MPKFKKQAPAVEGGGPRNEQNSINPNEEIIAKTEGCANAKSSGERDIQDDKSTTNGFPTKDAAGEIPDELVTGFMDLWQGGDHAFGTFHPDEKKNAETDGKRGGSYKTVKRAPTEDDFRQHLEGKVGLGIIPIRHDGTCSWGAIDIDDYGIDHGEIVRRCREQGLPIMVTVTKSGGLHLEVFFASPGPASEVRETLRSWSAAIGIWRPGLEIFPKQDQIDVGKSGSFLNLPYFGGDNTDRYAYDYLPGGDVFSLAEYVDIAQRWRRPWSVVQKLRPAVGHISPLLSPQKTEQGPSAQDDRPSGNSGGNLGSIPEGTRNNTLMSTAGKLWRLGIPTDAVEEVIRITNQQRCEPPLDDHELESTILKNIQRYDQGKIVPIGSTNSVPLIDCVFSTPELLEIEVPPRESIVDPFIKKPSLSMVCANRGLGKTWFALQLSIDVAMGRPFIGIYGVPEARNVLFIDGEMPLADLQERIHFLCPSGPPERLSIMPSEIVFHKAEPLNLNDEKHLRRIDELLSSLESSGQQPDLIVFDNLSSLSFDIDENSNSDLDTQNRWFVALRHRGYAVMLVHHTNKQGEQRGASRREDLLDTSIMLNPPNTKKGCRRPRGAKFRVTFTKTRGERPEPDEFTVELGYDERGFATWIFDLEEAPLPPRIQLLQQIYERKPGMQKELSGWSKGHISKLIRDLKAEGLLQGDLTLTKKGMEQMHLWFPPPPEENEEMPF